jgi:hypothetical protein
MSGEIDLSSGYVFDEADGEVVTLDKLNRMVQDAVARIKAGAVTSRELADGSISSDKLAEDLSSQFGVADGSITSNKIVNGAVTLSKLEDFSAWSIIARAGATAGAPSFLQATADGQFLTRQSGTLQFTALTAAMLVAGQGVIGVQGSKIFWGFESVNILSTLYWSAAKTITFPTAFSSATSYYPFAQIINADGVSIPGATAYSPYVSRTASTGMSLFCHRTDNPSSTAALQVVWIAIGT